MKCLYISLTSNNTRWIFVAVVCCNRDCYYAWRPNASP